MKDELIPLLTQVSLGSQSAFKELYTKTSSRLFAVCRQIMQDHHLAEEALQEAYVQVWHNATEYHSERGSPLVWMCAIARYRAINILRKRGNREVLTDTVTNEETTDGGPLDSLLDKVNDKKVKDCFDALTPDQRHSVMLAYYHGYSHTELSTVLKSPLGTVKSWVRRGLTSLKRCMAI